MLSTDYMGGEQHLSIAGYLAPHRWITPNRISLAGFLIGGVVTSVSILTLPLWVAGLLFAIGDLMDYLDGDVARRQGTDSSEGAIVDAVLDRYTDFLAFGALTYLVAVILDEYSDFLIGASAYLTENTALLLGLAALMGTMLTPYVRAKTEAEGKRSVPSIRRPRLAQSDLSFRPDLESAYLDIGPRRHSRQYLSPAPNDNCFEEGGAMTRVYADGVYDLFHFEHVESLRRARSLGDYLLVGVAADGEQLEAFKRKPILTMEERMASVAGCRYVDEVLPLPCTYFIDRAWIELHDIDLVVHGDDLTQKQLEYYYKVPIELGIFRKLPYTRDISTTDIIHRITGG